MSQPSEDPRALLARSAKLKLFVMLRRTVDRALLREHIGSHLRWMIDGETKGQIFLSGPVTPREGATPLDGLTLIRASTLAEAEDLARTDPFVRLGAIEFEMREWTANEGSITLNVTLSNSSVTF